MMEYVKQPKEIEDKSMRIIRPYLEGMNLSEEEIAVYSRTIHASGDVEYAKLVITGQNAITAGLNALKNGADIYCDVEMVRTGINKKALAKLGGEVFCQVSAPEIAEVAKAEGITRSIAAMRAYGKRLDGNIVAIGNAPTALYEVLRLCAEENVRPALIVGIPVGFVGAAESKALVEQAPVPFVTVRGNKGGSPIAASVINALLYLLVQRTQMLYIEPNK